MSHFALLLCDLLLLKYFGKFTYHRSTAVKTQLDIVTTKQATVSS
jgi:hypothetical protein